MKRQEWCLILLFDYKKIIEFNQKKCSKSFDKIKQTIIKKVFPDWDQTQALQKIGCKIHKLVSCHEIGVQAEEIIEVISGRKPVVLNAD